MSVSGGESCHCHALRTGTVGDLTAVPPADLCPECGGSGVIEIDCPSCTLFDIPLVWDTDDPEWDWSREAV